MMNSKVIAALIFAILAVSLIGVYVATQHESDNDNKTPSSSEVIDAVGRVVAVPDTLENGIVTIGSSGPLRFLSCFDVYDLIVEVDEGDIKDNKNGRAYSYAYPYDKLTRYHADNSLGSATAESIGNLNPSLIVVQESVWNNYNYNCNVLASRCTLVVIKDQSMTTICDSNYKLSADVRGTFELLGTLLGKEDRANEIINGIESILSDLRSLKGTSADNVYVAGLTIRGSNTLNTTYPTYMPLSLIGGNNSYKGNNASDKIVLNIEDFTKMNIDIVVIDPSSSDKIIEQDSQRVLEYLYKQNTNSTASESVKLYVTVPIIWDGINYDCSLASAYYLAYLLYGTLTHDEVEKKIEAIFTTFYGDHGKDVFSDMQEFFATKSANAGMELPLLEEVLITVNNGTYYLVATE